MNYHLVLCLSSSEGRQLAEVWVVKTEEQIQVLYLTWRASLDVRGSDVFGPPLQAEVVGRMSVLLTGQVELQILLAEL